jgi:hypothetical protein
MLRVCNHFFALVHSARWQLLLLFLMMAMCESPMLCCYRGAFGSFNPPADANSLWAGCDKAVPHSGA